MALFPSDEMHTLQISSPSEAGESKPRLRESSRTWGKEEIQMCFPLRCECVSLPALHREYKGIQLSPHFDF